MAQILMDLQSLNIDFSCNFVENDHLFLKNLIAKPDMRLDLFI